MKKDKFQPIVMPCTKEQYDALLPVLEQNEIRIARIKDNCPYSTRITNYYAKLSNFVARTYMPDAFFEIDRSEVKIYKRFNRKIFLKSLGIVEEPEFVLPEKWLVTYANREEFDIINKHFKKGWLYTNSINTNGYFSSDSPLRNNWLRSENDRKLLISQGYTEITFEQFQKYIVKPKQKQLLLESKKETMKTEFKNLAVRDIIKKGDLVENNNNIMIVTNVTGTYYDCTVVHKKAERSYDIGDTIQKGEKDITKVKGVLTLTQE